MADLPDNAACAPLGPERLLAQLGWVRALAHRLVSDPNVADDVLQRVCLRALEQPPRDVNGEAGLRRWLSTLTRRMASHAERSQRRRGRRERKAARPEALPPTVDLAAQREVMHDLVDVVTGLDARDATVLMQRYFDGLDIAEIAAREGVREDAVRQRLARARRRLRERLERRAGADRQRWLAALAPVVPAVGLGPAATLKPLGTVVMANSTSVVAVKIALGVSFVGLVALTAFHQLAEPAPSEVQADATPSVQGSPTPAPAEAARAPLPVVEAEAPAFPSRVETADGESIAGSTGVDEPAAAPGVLHPGLGSFASLSPDLQALNRWLRQLALSANVVEDSVVRDPDDGSVRGKLALVGSDVQMGFEIGPEGGFELSLEPETSARSSSSNPATARARATTPSWPR